MLYPYPRKGGIRGYGWTIRKVEAMDPNEALAEAVMAICDGDLEDFYVALNRLEHWLDAGGFAPDIEKVKEALG